ncbi:Beta-phenylalanine transaminase [Cyphellophora attinorum]|uniref:Beta-phenylalanine transaminase n=1 Tax=Cyphellophora attinorum TaxID=1664694 RepID=A0A0N0NLB0_9EURO|nr:Beta-phenylalanine transaminase [Phialophora attinorum]KPI39081.1 Beta-phenylalanine transaminase [Phialophora attinorum]
MGSISPVSELDHELSTAIDEYHRRNPKSYKVNQAAREHLPGGNTRTVLHTPPFPLSISKGSGSELTTGDGHVLKDFLGEYSAAIYGHDHPTIKAAIHSAAERGWNYGGQHELEGKLAATICSQERWGRGGMEMCRFVNSGTEANLLAVTTAVAYTSDRDRQEAEAKASPTPPKRNTILIFAGGYHGSVISSANRAPSSSSTNTSPKLSLNIPYNFVIAPYNDISATESLASTLAPNTLAAILVEPMLGSGGCFSALPAFLRFLRHLADSTGALLIYDEVMTSLGSRHMDWGKFVGGGMSFGAFGGRKDIMSLFDPEGGRLEHPGTFNNNIFTMSTGLAGLGVLTPEVMADLNGRGESLRRQLEDVFSRHGFGFANDTKDAAHTAATDPVPGVHRPSTEAELAGPKQTAVALPPLTVRARGSMLVIHFNLPSHLKPKFQNLFWLHMLSQGYWIAARGFITLSIVLTDEDVRGFVQAVDSFLERYGALLQRVRQEAR